MKNLKSIAAVVAIATLLLAVGCTKTTTPSVKAQVERSLEQAGLKEINVDEDRDKRLITLKGNLPDMGQKTQAEQAAQAAAPGWAISNEIGVLPTGDESDAKKVAGNLDDAIESNFKASLIASKLDDAGIKYHAKNGVLTLEGTVANPPIRDQAQQLAGGVPNVREVVNKLDVKHQLAKTSK
jgi:osmotically-inducible protein OsmY